VDRPAGRQRPLGRPFADQHVLGDVGPSRLTVPRPRNPQRTSGTQAGDQLPSERTSAFDIEGLVDRLVADPHGLIFGEVDLEPVGDLFGAPRAHPATIAAVRLVPSLPLRPERPDHLTVDGANDSGQPILMHPNVKPTIPVRTASQQRRTAAGVKPDPRPTRKAWP